MSIILNIKKLLTHVFTITIICLLMIPLSAQTEPRVELSIPDITVFSNENDTLSYTMTRIDTGRPLDLQSSSWNGSYEQIGSQALRVRVGHEWRKKIESRNNTQAKVVSPNVCSMDRASLIGGIIRPAATTSRFRLFCFINNSGRK